MQPPGSGTCRERRPDRPEGRGGGDECAADDDASQDDRAAAVDLDRPEPGGVSMLRLEWLPNAVQPPGSTGSTWIAPGTSSRVRVSAPRSSTVNPPGPHTLGKSEACDGAPVMWTSCEARTVNCVEISRRSGTLPAVEEERGRVSDLRGLQQERRPRWRSWGWGADRDTTRPGQSGLARRGRCHRCRSSVGRPVPDSHCQPTRRRRRAPSAHLRVGVGVGVGVGEYVFPTSERLSLAFCFEHLSGHEEEGGTPGWP